MGEAKECRMYMSTKLELNCYHHGTKKLQLKNEAEYVECSESIARKSTKKKIKTKTSTLTTHATTFNFPQSQADNLEPSQKQSKQINGQKIKTGTSSLITHVHVNKSTKLQLKCYHRVTPRQQKTTSHMPQNQVEYLEHNDNQSKKINKII